MVQLKGLHPSNILKDMYISIPYGSIKSIPILLGGCAEIPFQFLMVQLKAYGMLVIKSKIPISIPYGSIKSRMPVLWKRKK